MPKWTSRYSSEGGRKTTKQAVRTNATVIDVMKLAWKSDRLVLNNRSGEQDPHVAGQQRVEQTTKHSKDQQSSRDDTPSGRECKGLCLVSTFAPYQVEQSA